MSLHYLKLRAVYKGFSHKNITVVLENFEGYQPQHTKIANHLHNSCNVHNYTVDRRAVGAGQSITSNAQEPEQSGHHFTDDLFSNTFCSKENWYLVPIMIDIALKRPTYNKAALV